MTPTTKAGRALDYGTLITLRRDMVTYVDEMTDRMVDRALIAEGVSKRLAAIEAAAIATEQEARADEAEALRAALAATDALPEDAPVEDTRQRLYSAGWLERGQALSASLATPAAPVAVVLCQATNYHHGTDFRCALRAHDNDPRGHHWWPESWFGSTPAAPVAASERCGWDECLFRDAPHYAHGRGYAIPVYAIIQPAPAAPAEPTR